MKDMTGGFGLRILWLLVVRVLVFAAHEAMTWLSVRPAPIFSGRSIHPRLLFFFVSLPRKQNGPKDASEK